MSSCCDTPFSLPCWAVKCPSMYRQPLAVSLRDGHAHHPSCWLRTVVSCGGLWCGQPIQIMALWSWITDPFQMSGLNFTALVGIIGEWERVVLGMCWCPASQSDLALAHSLQPSLSDRLFPVCMLCHHWQMHHAFCVFEPNNVSKMCILNK